MSPTVAVVVVLAVLVGVSLGMLGGGGSILTVPLLVYVAGLDAKVAIAASLFVVGVTSVAGLVSHARHGRVKWRTGLIFGLAGMIGAYSAGLVGGHLPGNVLLIAFAAMMVATSLAMLRGRKNPPAHASDGELPVRRIVVDGLVVGVATGLVGAGGGFLVVPALVLLGGLPMSVAVGTSLLVISMKSFAGLAGYLSSVELPWGLVLSVTAAAVVGSVLGGRLAGRVPEARLRRAFGWFVLVMGGFVLVQQGPAWAAPAALTVIVTAGLAAGACWQFVRACPLRRVVAG
ncbi:sulfite exporter TauE/SafE family protein [Nocardioides sp. zg-1228]|uniref:sulfite exporter TauE/SafE family protein n=1 Tax=Nocardioides sp. zg-1228 TaxID=2763008 RepID=UPI00164254F7|nr:sulfite exporter TauE/SafE family protein [Nocardioides sp. zg-1228]MBC2934279.1 sulfite exporter TauE/SafE family protein [Nocardioides sp. zg-1228]QSF59058.1 sulfite exporter TauE/SafE family protein [Nocardioides sp. zg-1228]